MRIELSPGDWAGVLDAVRERIDAVRHQAASDESGYPDLAQSQREYADDLARVATSLREQIADGGVSPLEGAYYCPDCGNALDDWRGHGSECAYKEVEA